MTKVIQIESSAQDHAFNQMRVKELTLDSNLIDSTLPPGQVGLKLELPKNQVGQ